MKQFLKILCFTTFFMMLSGTYYAKADTLDLVENILLPTEITDFYNYNLNSVQQEIASYLVGCYNSIYLGARGFNATDNTFSDSNVYFATMKMYGNKIFNFAKSVASRFDNVLNQYISSVLMYAQLQNYNSFQDWYNNLDSDFYIPYSSNSLNSWDNFYNDNSNDGISTFGDSVNNWVSGTLYDYNGSDMPFYDTNSQERYNNFIINYSPVLFTDIDNNQYQKMIGFGVNSYPNTLIFYTNDGYNYSYRYGIYDGLNLSTFNSFNVYSCVISYGNSPGKVMVQSTYYGDFICSGSVYNLYSSTFRNFLDTCFYLTPIRNGRSGINNRGFYPYINHVFRVDDINTLVGKEEIFDVDGFKISNDKDYIMKPINNYSLKVTNINYPDNNNYFKYIIVNSVDDNNEPVDDNDFMPNPVILNNPTTDAYYKPYSPTSPLPSFDIGLFGDAGGQIIYFKECAVKFIIYTRQVLDCFSFNDGEEGPVLIIVAVLIIGIAGGLVIKMLL